MPWDHRLRAHAVAWGVPVLLTGSLMGPRSYVPRSVCDGDATAWPWVGEASTLLQALAYTTRVVRIGHATSL